MSVNLETRVASLEGAYQATADAIFQRLASIDGRLNSIDARLNARDARLATISSTNFDAANAKIGQPTRWIVGILLAGWITILGAIFFHH